MVVLFREEKLSSGWAILIGVLSIILLGFGIYLFLSSFSETADKVIPETVSSSVNNSSGLGEGAKFIETDKNIILIEGNIETVYGQNLTVEKIGMGSILVNLNSNTTIISIGKEHDFGNVRVKLNVINYSNAPNKRRANIKLIDSTDLPKENLSQEQVYGVILGERESYGINEYLGMLDVLSIGKNQVSVKFGSRTANISGGETYDFGPLNVTVSDILYTENDYERKVALIAIPIPERYTNDTSWEPIPEDNVSYPDGND